MLADRAKSRIILYNLVTNKIDYEGEIIFDVQSVNTSFENTDLNKALFNYKDLDHCDIQYDHIPFPDLELFKNVPWSSCCMSFKVVNTGYFMCHSDPYACIVPSRRIMYKIRSKCRVEMGIAIKDFFNFSISQYQAGFWRGYL